MILKDVQRAGSAGCLNPISHMNRISTLQGIFIRPPVFDNGFLQQK